MTLEGKRIVVVGGTTGLGLSAARAFVAAGARVLVTGRDSDRVAAAVKSLGESGAGLPGDASDPVAATAAIDRIVELWGGLDGLYHVAGGSGRQFGDGPLHELTDEGVRKTIDLNLTSVIYSNRAAVRRFLEENRGGSILNMGSVLGYAPSSPFFSAHVYATTKAAIIGLTRSAANHYASRNIRFNVLAPAVTETPMARRAAEDDTILRFIETKQRLDGGRMGRPEDCDAAAVYFMSDAARFTTGQLLAVDGGWSISEGQIPQQ